MNEKINTYSISKLFEKHVPEALRAKKCGLNIAIVGDFNIAGQLTTLFRLINEKTIHRARCIILQGDYLSYDQDIVFLLMMPAIGKKLVKSSKMQIFFI